jgi:hypothetical protein
VVVGMFPVESHLTKVLFNIGVMHSFVTTTWVEAHNISIEPVVPPLRVKSVGWTILAYKMCPNLMIEIRGT